jgi:GST-like protein
MVTSTAHPVRLSTPSADDAGLGPGAERHRVEMGHEQDGRAVRQRATARQLDDEVAGLRRHRDAGMGVVEGNDIGGHADLDECAGDILADGLFLAGDALDGKEAHEAVEGGLGVVGDHGSGLQAVGPRILPGRERGSSALPAGPQCRNGIVSIGGRDWPSRRTCPISGTSLPANDPPPCQESRMSVSDYTPPKVWTWNKASGGRFANINRPIAGPTHEKDLPVGKHPLQLYSLGTPNGVKVTVMLEELLALGHTGAEYDAWLIRISEGDQFSSGFVGINPNSKIPALVDRSGPEPIRVFESGAILVHLAEKFGAFLPTDPAKRAETLSWLFWQMGSAPFLGGGFGHFYAYAPTKIEYAIDRYAMEVKRQMDVLDRRLAESEYIAGPDYTIADMAIWPWYGNLAKGLAYEAGEFLSVQDYKNVQRWTDQIAARPAAKRGRMVNRAVGDPASQLRERHDASDFETKTQDKIEAGG